MKELYLSLLLLLFEFSSLHGHVIAKREATDVDRYIVKSDKDTIEIINPKARKPTLREIIFYHVIETPYPNTKQTKIINNDEKIIPKDNNLILKDDDKVSINDFPRPWTNGHGFQYLNGNNLNDQNEADDDKSSIIPSLTKPGPVFNDIATSSDYKNDDLPDDNLQNFPIDDNLAQEDGKNDQENDKDPKEVENDIDITRVINDNTPKTNESPVKNGRPRIERPVKNERPIRIERPVKNGRPVHIERPAENERPVENGRPIRIERPVKNGKPLYNERPAKSNPTDTDDDEIYNEDLLDDEEVARENPVKQNGIPDLQQIEDDKTIRFRDFITEDQAPKVARRKRDIDYSKMHEAPPLPLFKTDFFPDYIKDILPSNDELDIPTETEKPASPSEKPAYLSRKTEKPAYLSKTTEESVYLTEKPEVARKPVYLSKTAENPVFMLRSNENLMPKTSEEQKITKKSARNVDEEIEKEINEAIKKVAEAQDMNTKAENPSFGMNLIGNGGVVWNDLNGQHFRYNVGPDATNTEDHNAQIPIRPTTEKLEDTTEKDLSSEIQSALEEIGHIFEEILDETDKEIESEIVPTENYDIHVNINKDHDKHEKFEENTDFEKERSKVNKNQSLENIENPNDFENEGSKVDENQSLDGQVKTKTVENDDDQDTFNQVMDFLHVLQDLVENSEKNESENQENEVKDNVIEPSKDNSESKSNDEIEDNSDTPDAVNDLLNNENYWKWLKDTSESFMNIILERSLGLIKEEVAKQIQHLTDDHDDKPLDKHNSDSTTERLENEKENGDDNFKEHHLKADDKYWNWLKDSSEAYINILMKRVLGEIAEGVENQIDILANKIFKENGYPLPNKDENNNFKQEDDVEDSEVIQTLKDNDKWEWLTKSSDAYLDKNMKRVNQLIEEEVNRQIIDLVKYHMPINNNEQTNTQNNPDGKKEKADENDVNLDKREENDVNLDDNDDNESKPDVELLRKPKDQLEKSKDEISGKKGKDKKKHEDDHKQKDKNKHKHDHKQKDKNEHHHHEDKQNDENKAENVKISATNSFGTSMNNEKVTNIFIFGQNSKDLTSLIPISGSNGIFIFGTDSDKDQNQVSDEHNTEPNKVTDNSNTDPIVQEDKVEISTATPVKEENELETVSDSNKEENDKDNSKETEKENQETPEEASEESEENKTEDNWEESGKDNENKDTDSKDTGKDLEDEDKAEENQNASLEENETEDIRGETGNTDKDSKDADEDLEDEFKVMIDERLGETDESKDKEIKDSSENVKHKESTDVKDLSENVEDIKTTDTKDSSENVKDKESTGIKDSSENVNDKESTDTKDSSENVKDKESTDTKDSSENVEDKESTDIKNSSENVDDEKPTDIKDSSENVKDKESTGIKDSSENVNVNDKESTDTKDSNENLKDKESTDTKDSSENVEDKESTDIKNSSENVDDEKPTDIKDSSENVKDKESTGIKDSSENVNVNDKESTDTKDSNENLKDKESTDTKDSSENVEDKESTDIKNSSENVDDEKPTDIKESSENVEDKESTDTKDSSENVEDKE